MAAEQKTEVWPPNITVWALVKTPYTEYSVTTWVPRASTIEEMVNEFPRDGFEVTDAIIVTEYKTERRARFEAKVTDYPSQKFTIDLSHLPKDPAEVTRRMEEAREAQKISMKWIHPGAMAGNELPRIPREAMTKKYICPPPAEQEDLKPMTEPAPAVRTFADDGRDDDIYDA